MAYSYVQYTGNGATTNYAFSFPYLDSSHIKVRVNGTITSFTFVNSGTVQISPAPATGTIIDIRRETPKDLAPVNFTDGSVLLEQDLDLLASFNLYTAQESADGVADSITKDTLGVWDAQSRRIKNVADPVNAQDAVNKNWAETGMSSQLASATAQAAIATTKAGEAASSASSASTSASTATTKASEASASATSAGNSATSATGSASTATTKASEALASQVAAASSASTASTKASEANTSAGNAASSATTASTQAGVSTTKATEASSSASAAATSASTATTKADSATASATAAAGSAATATTKAAEADADAISAASSASNAASSASNAATSASTATTKAAEAVVSASDSAASAVSAASSAASAAALLDNFDDRYLGAKASAPSVDNDGNALQLGALYFDSTTGKMRVYTASGWLDASSASVATLAVFNYTATASQTSFSGSDIASQTLTYTVGSLFVTLNGIDLKNGTDYTATTGSSIVLASGAAAGDELRVYAFGSFLVADTYTRAQADAGFVAKLPSGDASISGLTVGKGGGADSSATAFGVSALASNIASGNQNTAVGYQAMTASTTAYNSVAIGFKSLFSNTTGNTNSALGFGTLQANTTGSSNTALGYQTLFANTTASYNTAVGYQAGYSNTTGVNVTAFGYQAGYSHTTGNYNVFIGGRGCGYSATTGDQNTFVGDYAGRNVTTGGQNTLIGQGAGYLITTGTKNTVLGVYSGNQGGLDIRTASNNIVLSDGDGNPRMRADSNGQFYSLITGVGLYADYGCRAWLKISASSGTPSIAASGNISSLADNGTGYYGVNFTNPMPDANYSIVGCLKPTSGQAGNNARAVNVHYSSGQGAGYFNVVTATAGAGYEDPDFVYLSVFR